MKSEKKVIGVVLAGGEGKRLRPLSYYFQKCMIPIGTKQKPLLEYVICLLSHYGISDINLLVGYKHEQIENYFGDGNRFGAKITYSYDDPSVKGTGAALLNLYNKGLVERGTSILICYGDILSNINLTEMMAQHQESKAAATLALARGFQVPVGVAEVKEKRVTHWVEKPELDLLAGIGILALDAGVLEELRSLGRSLSDLDITRDFIPHLINKGYLVSAYITDAFWYDVGSTEKYEKLDNGVIEKHFRFIFS